jgi:hypothetical protein
MSALTLMIIRHAEKPREQWPGPGLTIEGIADEKSLVIRGWQRAGAWSALFGAGLGGIDFPRPDVIYAADPTRGIMTADPADGPSQRPSQTVTPLGDNLGPKPVTKWALGEEAALVDEIKKLSGVVLVCWEHKRIISDMLPAIAAGMIVPGLPSKWNKLRFDVVLRFDRGAPAQPWSFRQLFPRLLSGDSDKPLGS